MELYNICIAGYFNKSINNDSNILKNIEELIQTEYSPNFIDKWYFKNGFIYNDIFEYNFTIKTHLVDNNNSKLNLFLKILDNKLKNFAKKNIFDVEINII